jgi:hypothetical protein
LGSRDRRKYQKRKRTRNKEIKDNEGFEEKLTNNTITWHGNFLRIKNKTAKTVLTTKLKGDYPQGRLGSRYRERVS